MTASLPLSSSSHVADFAALVEILQAQACAARQRRVLVLAGEAGWCREMARRAVAVLGLSRISWVSSASVLSGEMPGGEILEAGAAKRLLGQERDLLVFDAHAGFDPDVFGATTGAVCGGGLLILLCPRLVAWARFADPAAERIAVFPFGYADVGSRFLRRLVRIVTTGDGVAIVEQGELLPSLETEAKSIAVAECVDEVFRTTDQQAAVVAIEQVLRGRRRRPLVLVSDRGRGKTAALGIAAAQLLTMAQRPLRIVVTAPRLAAVAPLFAQARRLLPAADAREGHLRLGASSLEFIAPDVLCLSTSPADLVLVDEAAAIPASLLRTLLNRYARLVFASTEHGYEGTGRGFAVRFRQVLDAHTPGWTALRLTQPIRWAKHDPLERLVFRMLLLDAAPAADAAVRDVGVAETEIARLDRGLLADDEPTLGQLFGLLVTAHYRTTPNDLRNLLDGPGLQVYIMRYREQIVATALVAAEGGFDATLAEAIYSGRRRPRGHLLPQSLVTHVGLQDAASLRCARIMRIAVHPALQRRGLGSALLHHLRDEAQRQGFQLLGASFGATPGLLHFWRRAGLRPARVGFRRGQASGEHSVMVLAPIDAAGEMVCRAAYTRLAADLPHWLSDPLRELDSAVVVALLAGDIAPVVNEADRRVLGDFAAGYRGFEDTLGPLWRLAVSALLGPLAGLPAQERDVLVARVLQKREWAQVSILCGLTGRAAIIDCLRRAVGRLLDGHTYCGQVFRQRMHISGLSAGL
jgi:tRNA(Met) cytidine acetyltransferase